LTTVASDLSGLIDDSRFIIDNSSAHVPDSKNNTQQNLFALGTTDAKRNERLNYLKTRRAWYQSQLDGLRQAVTAAKCDDTTWGAACSALATKWRDFDSSAEYVQFPVRYISSCYAGANLDHTIDLEANLAQGVIGLRNSHGDTERGGGPANVRASIVFGLNSNRGNPCLLPYEPWPSAYASSPSLNSPLRPSRFPPLLGFSPC
jgi:hypothetical protein